MLKRAPQRRRDGARPGADLGDPSVSVVPHHHAGGVAREALRRFRGDAHAAFEHRLAWRIGVRQHTRLDVDDHLVSLARGPGIDAMVQRRLREEAQRVRLLLAHRRLLHDNADH